MGSSSEFFLVNMAYEDTLGSIKRASTSNNNKSHAKTVSHTLAHINMLKFPLYGFEFHLARHPQRKVGR